MEIEIGEAGPGTPERSISDPSGFQQAFEENFSSIYRYIARRVGAALADDLAAETFAVAFRRRRDFNPALASVRSWLYGIATNLLRNHWRAELHLLELDSRLRIESELLENPSLPEDRLSMSMLAPRLAAALALLPGPQREVLLLHAWSELTNEEIAGALDIAPGTVRSRLSRARALLREHFGLFDFGLWLFSGDVESPQEEGRRCD